ncbi:helix-turn-helix transcriptional regulator [Streptomyces incarnatus]
MNTSPAATEFIAPLERSLAVVRAETVALSGKLSSLLAAERLAMRHGDGPGPKGEWIDSRAAAVLIADAASECRQEMLVACAIHLAHWQSHDLALRRACVRLARNASLRVLCPSTERDELAANGITNSALGGDDVLRLHSESIDPFILLDHETLFVPSPVPSGHAAGGVFVLRDVMLSGLIRSLFNQIWDNSITMPDPSKRSSLPADQVRAAILRMLAQGDKDEVVARRLGMALRTYRRYVAGICADLGATSRFQAGFAAAQMDASFNGRHLDRT